ncbi:hypothetical protein CDL15_Pgr001866 [Punica granatum]|uniref:Fe2OG dioxygenase domain-containing protein n=1 Tax=Punica granatum TaxID=22663 RepID=A0A218XD64_PUNGR|nr:hypothetical protein CDL15_Pgr001866 [Punica granatum]
MLGSLQELFDLPLETKTRNVAKKLFHGYVGQHPHIPLYESMGIDDADVQEKVDELVSSLWPQGHPTFSKTIQSYAEKLSTLDHIVRRMILESLGVEKYLEEHLNSTYYFLRITKYKGPQTPETEVGLPTHTDQNLLTILYQNQINGLEVLTKNGEWISVKPSPESFIVIAGESLYAWSNGRIHSAKHRVMMSGSETRNVAHSMLQIYNFRLVQWPSGSSPSSDRDWLSLGILFGETDNTEADHKIDDLGESRPARMNWD